MPIPLLGRILWNPIMATFRLLFRLHARSRAMIYVDGVHVPVALAPRVSVIAKNEGRHAVIVEFGDLELACVCVLVTAAESERA